MHRRLIIALVLLVGLPLVGLTLLAVKVVGDERDMALVQWRELLEGRLQDLANGIAAQTESVEREALDALDGARLTADGLRELVRNSPLVSQSFLLGGDGRLTFPPDDATTSAEERAFLTRTRSIWTGRAILYGPPRAEETAEAAPPAPRAVPVQMQQKLATTKRARPPTSTSGPRDRRGDSLLDLSQIRDVGWITWYWQEGLHLLLWRRAPQGAGTATGGVIGVEVDRVAALGRVLGRLPDPANLEGRIVLMGGRGVAIAQWGPLEPESGAKPAARVALGPPWDAWWLEYYPSEKEQAGFRGPSALWTWGPGLGALVVSLLLLAVYFYRESDREMREAAQRVTFVTQVSHELKTPLTNIRLYAELLDRDLELFDDEDDSSARSRLATIVTEAQRLSRLISNILTFSRQRRGKLTVTPQPFDLDARVRGMVEQFGPALTACDVDVEVEWAAPAPTHADKDSVDQIVANLLSNVEKYAAGGGWLGVRTRQDEAHSYVEVADLGPGIPKEHRERVFLPFYRVSDRLSDGVTGTGIGLALSAELARKNGGSLALVPSERGTVFRLTLPRG